jgi:ArsR family transcriptional regulator, arsenate/arsenite/antimonite-responsive transcriptional repressor
MKSKTAVASLSALAHDGRLAAFRLLVKAGPDGLPAGVIAHKLGVSPSSLTFNLNLLSSAGLIASRRDGRSIIYRVDYDAIRALLAFLIEDCCSGSAEICRPLVDVLAACGTKGYKAFLPKAAVR